LFRQAKIEVQRRLFLIPDQQARLTEFRARRALLQMPAAADASPERRRLAGGAD
jgi:hypothetical protein